MKIRNSPTSEIENQLRINYKYIAGIDEAGRGPLAGPVVAASVILKDIDFSLSGINDSKKLSEENRKRLFSYIINNSISYSVSFVNNNIIDDINILKATMKAMHYSIKELSVVPDFLLIDGNYFVDIGINYKTIIKGDSKSLSIAAASILAKHARDKWMIEIADSEFPEYKFARNKGYGTKEHIDNIIKYGPCKYHRKTFLKKIISGEIKLF